MLQLSMCLLFTFNKNSILEASSFGKQVTQSTLTHTNSATLTALVLRVNLNNFFVLKQFELSLVTVHNSKHYSSMYYCIFKSKIDYYSTMTIKMKKENLSYFNIIILCINHSLNLAKFFLFKAFFIKVLSLILLF